MATTIRAVAEAAGVSTTTVSFVLNNRHPHIDAIPKQTRDRVKECAAALGYRRNAAAASLRTGRSHWIGVIVQAMRSEEEAYKWAPYEMALLSGAQNGLAERGYFAVLGSKSTTGDTESLDAVVCSGVGGLISRRPLREEVNRLRKLMDEGVPSIVVFPAKSEDLYPYSIDLDNFTGGKMAAELFARAGRKTPMCITSEGAVQSEQERQRGFVEGIAEQMGSPPPVCELATEAAEDVRSEALAKFIRANKPDSILAVGPHSARLVSFAAEKLELDVPGDVAIIGFDCYSFPSARNQRLSAVGTSWWRAGLIAAESIVDMVTHDTKWIEPKKLEPVFIPGDSTPAELAGEGAASWFA